MKDILKRCDGVLIPGGDDIDPALYGQERTSFKDELKPLRDQFEPQLIEACIDADIPFLGICRGLQIANVALGGTLHQDIASLKGTHLNHWQEEPFSTPSHDVSIKDDTPLADIFGAGVLRVNSVHHQAVANVAPKLKVNAVSKDGLVEALSYPESTFFVAVQWHPEFAVGAPFSEPLSEAFVTACKNNYSERTA